MVWRIRVDWLEDNDERRATPLAHGRICHLEHEEGSPTSDMHAYFEVSTPKDWPLLADEPGDVHHLVAATILEQYPRREGSVWDLIATALRSAGLGREEGT